MGDILVYLHRMNHLQNELCAETCSQAFSPSHLLDSTPTHSLPSVFSPHSKSHPQVLPFLAEAPFPLDLFLSLCDDPALELEPPAPPSSLSLGFETSVFAGETSSGLDSSYDANTHQPLFFSKYP